MITHLKVASLVGLLALAGCAANTPLPPTPLERALGKRTSLAPPPPPPPPPPPLSSMVPSYAGEFTCPRPEVWFAPGSATVSKDDIARLTNILPQIEKHCGNTIVIGFADPSDNVPDREQLARHRAGVVADILIKAGRDPKMVKVRSSVISVVSKLTDQISETRSARVDDDTMP